MKRYLFLLMLLTAIGRMSIHAQSWTAVGTGMNDRVQSLAGFNGSLYAGGEFVTAGGNPASRIAEWNGTTWSALGIGVNDDVYALAVYNSELYVGGYFDTAGSVQSSLIAKWNGTTW